MKTLQQYKKGTAKTYEDAVWQYLLDHSDVTNDGSLFVKFHIRDRKKFTKGVIARMNGICRNSYNAVLMEQRRKETLSHGQIQSALQKLKNETQKSI